MEKQSYSLLQVSTAFLNFALSLEYHMSDEFGLYENKDINSIIWRESLSHLLEWSLDKSFDLGLRAYELETWGDNLLLDDFKPIVEKLIEKNQMLKANCISSINTFLCS